MPNGTLAMGGIELVKFFVLLALQEARRSKMTSEQIAEAFGAAKTEFERNRPELIPDV